jgi:hypothetical protein
MALKSGRVVTNYNARAVARKVIEKMKRGEVVKISPLMREVGYSKNTAINPSKVTNSPAYKEEIESYVARLEKHRLKILEAMEKKDLTEEQYRTLVEAQAKTTHDVQLLSGGKTENVGVEKDRETLKAIVAAIQIESNSPDLLE